MENSSENNGDKKKKRGFFVSSGTTDGKVFNPNDYDDCAVCRLMRRAAEENRQPTEQEFLEVFTEANNKSKCC